eukprot:Gregarina_sp_Pseudo_9__2312@NODE_262_length_3360_cov_153_092743_g245_i0_p2_GENE_NODE_262_length_3360_cov_153_092743_g245_i0NODE_262_length_3360_cov_153_092743_g245_i0_p2_ORF_typecomplete_len388_score27_32_NODE_262_length_3360_cov_153_092743_g245_i05121675
MKPLRLSIFCLVCVLAFRTVRGDSDDIVVPGLSYPEVEQADKDALAAPLAALGALVGVVFFKLSRRWAIDVTEPRRRIVHWICRRNESQTNLGSDVQCSDVAAHAAQQDMVIIEFIAAPTEHGNPDKLLFGTGSNSGLDLSNLQARVPDQVVPPPKVKRRLVPYLDLRAMTSPPTNRLQERRSSAYLPSSLSNIDSAANTLSDSESLLCFARPDLPFPDSPPRKIVLHSGVSSARVCIPKPAPRVCETSLRKSRPASISSDETDDSPLAVAFEIPSLYTNAWNGRITPFDAEVDRFLRERVRAARAVRPPKHAFFEFSLESALAQNRVAADPKRMPPRIPTLRFRRNSDPGLLSMCRAPCCCFGAHDPAFALMPSGARAYPFSSRGI